MTDYLLLTVQFSPVGVFLVFFIKWFNEEKYGKYMQDMYTHWYLIMSSSCSAFAKLVDDAMRTSQILYQVPVGKYQI